ncbi:MAG TPA: RDD family protein [Acidimicrobiales bacterium]
MAAATPARSTRPAPRTPAPAPGGRVAPPAPHLRAAGAARRLAAAAVDATIVPALALGGAEVARWSSVLRLAGVSDAGWSTWSRSYALVAWTVVAAAVAYHGLCTAAWQRTPGKALAGLVVVAGDGRRPGPAVALWRAAWSAAPYAPALLAPALVVIAATSVLSPARLSLADRAAGTRVVRAPSAPLGPAARRRGAPASR